MEDSECLRVAEMAGVSFEWAAAGGAAAAAAVLKRAASKLRSSSSSEAEGEEGDSGELGVVIHSHSTRTSQHHNAPLRTAHKHAETTTDNANTSREGAEAGALPKRLRGAGAWLKRWRWRRAERKEKRRWKRGESQVEDRSARSGRYEVAEIIARCADVNMHRRRADRGGAEKRVEEMHRRGWKRKRRSRSVAGGEANRWWRREGGGRGASGVTSTRSPVVIG